MRRSLLDDRILASLGLAHKFILLGLGVMLRAASYWFIRNCMAHWLLCFLLPAGFGAREGVFTFNLSLFLSGGIAGIVAIVSRTLNVLIEIIAFVFGLTMMSSEELEEG